MDLTILVVGLILGVGIPLRNKAIKKRRENMKEKGNEEKWKNWRITKWKNMNI